MSMKYGKAEITKMIEVLDGDHETVDDAAKAALEAAEEVFEKRAKFVVVGQQIASRDRQEIPPSDPEAIKLSLGWYSTEGDAIKAAESLWHSTASGDTFATWAIPVFHGTPAQLHDKAKQKYVAEARKAEERKTERIQKQIEMRDRENEERAKFFRQKCTCGHGPLDHAGKISDPDRCKQCDGCAKYNPLVIV